ncbi:MAG: hypothetical protein IJT12_04425 [Paludibacteraceae bacterium]|nr:hypothetical protein [Paludibacteraceae bacterium]
MKRKNMSIIGCLLTAAMTAAVPQHYIDVHAGAGVGSWGYTLDGGTTQIGNTYSAGTGYTWFFLPTVGLQTGLQVTRISSYAVLTKLLEYGPLTDYQDEQYVHRVAFSNWREKEEAWFLQVPVGLRFAYFANENSQAGLHAAVGVSLTIPMHANAHTTGTVTHTGWYESWQIEFHDLPGRFMTESMDQRSDTKSRLLSVNAMMYAELGTTIRLGQRTQMLITAYAQYGLNDFSSVKRSDRTPLGFANAANGYTFMSEYKGLFGTDKIGVLTPWTAGLKLALSVRAGRTDEQKKQLLLKLATEFPDVLPCPPEEKGSEE